MLAFVLTVLPGCKKARFRALVFARKHELYECPLTRYLLFLLARKHTLMVATRRTGRGVVQRGNQISVQFCYDNRGQGGHWPGSFTAANPEAIAKQSAI